mgnify:CR=1 FL=1
MMSTVIRVVLADDHPVVRSGIRAEFDRQADLNVIGEAVDGTEALRIIRDLKPDVVLLDLNMPGERAVRLLRAIRAENLPTRVVILSALDDAANVLGMLRQGACGYLLKDETPVHIAEAVRSAHAGQSSLSPRVAQHVLAASLRPAETLGPGGLTARELDVLRLAARGKNNADIAAHVGVRERTVRFHFENILSKLGVANRTEAVARAIAESWLSLE